MLRDKHLGGSSVNYPNVTYMSNSIQESKIIDLDLD